ncbi:MAG: hypothetical protein V4532_15870, partial [Pseudomonadota bacterium]
MPAQGTNPYFGEKQPLATDTYTPAYANGGSVRAPEEIVAIGTQTGRPYFTAGEPGAGLEKITVKPMQGGGDATVGYDPNDPFGGQLANQASQTDRAPYGTAPLPPPPIPQYNIIPPNPYAQYGNPVNNAFAANQNVINSRQGEIGAGQAVINAQGQVLDAQGNVIPAQQGALNARGNVINASRGVIGPSYAYLDAQGNVINAQQAQTAGERGYIGQQQGANAQSQQEEAAYQAA